MSVMELQRPSLASDLRLSPRAKTVLRHLEKGKSITPLEADAVYGINSLAGAVHELRLAGYSISRELKNDEVGHRYARYALAKPTLN